MEKQSDNFGETMDMENNNTSIKDDIIAIIKESIKFALVAITLLFVVGMPLLYILTKFTEIDIEIAAFLSGGVVAILTTVIDHKKIHVNDKILECNKRIVRKVLKLM